MKTQSSTHHKRYTQELRSEKVSNIVGPIPPALIRYGIVVICLALIIVISVSAFLPFRKVVSGVAYISEVYFAQNDTIYVKAQLKFIQSNNMINPEGCRIIFNKLNYETRGIVYMYTPIRTEQGEYKAELIFNNSDIKHFENTETDFRIILSETTVLNRLLASIRVKNN